MRKSVKYVAALLAATMTIGGLTGCVNSASSDTGSNTAASDSNAGVEESASSDNDYDFYIFNAKGENADALAAAVDTYEAETGLTIKIFSLGSGTPTEEALRVDMSSDHKPAIFGIMDPQALKEWVEGDFALDLTTADLLPEFKALADDLDPGLRSSSGFMIGRRRAWSGCGWMDRTAMAFHIMLKDMAILLTRK